MHSTTLITLVALAFTVAALPSPDYDSQFQQLTFSPELDAVVHKTTDYLKGAVEKGREVLNHAEEEGVRRFEMVESDGIMHELITHDDFPAYQIRLKKTTLCDPTVKSYSGYLDIDAETHLYFWFFESRGSPSKDPLVAWFNGGPGCSSSTGLLFELGPCSIANEGQNTTFNKYSWNEAANMIFIDSPTQVGYSYGSKSVNNSPDTAKDIYAFMQLFYTKFPKFENNDFHASGESYAGTYLPNIGSFIHSSNLALPTKSSRIIPLKSLLIGNGLTDSYTQFASIPDYACGDSKFAIFDEPTCDNMRSKIPTCQRLTTYCYNNPNRFTCVPATLSCWQIAAPIQSSGLNPYDVRKKCDREGEDGPLCYREMQWIETYLNKPEIKQELGVAPERNFESCNMKINQAFQFNGDVSHNTAALLPPLLEAGIRVLIYAGEADFMCSYVGNLAWTLALEWSGQDNYTLAKPEEMTYGKRETRGGSTRSVGEGAGLFTFLQVYDAGHMVPMDQPEFSLDFFSKWIKNEPFVQVA